MGYGSDQPSRSCMVPGDIASEDDAAAAVAVMEFTVVSLEGIKISPADEKRFHITAWMDPSVKQRLRADRIRHFYFPLHISSLESATSSVTIELVYSPRIPFHRQKLLGSAALLVSSVRIAARRSTAAQPILLPLKTPSGRFRGVVTVSARILWDLGFPAGDVDLNEMDPASEDTVHPTAPPLPEERDNSRSKLVGGVAAAATAVIIGVAFRRLKI